MEERSRMAVLLPIGGRCAFPISRLIAMSAAAKAAPTSTATTDATDERTTMDEQNVPTETQSDSEASFAEAVAEARQTFVPLHATTTAESESETLRQFRSIERTLAAHVLAVVKLKRQLDRINADATSTNDQRWQAASAFRNGENTMNQLLARWVEAAGQVPDEIIEAFV